MHSFNVKPIPNQRKIMSQSCGYGLQKKKKIKINTKTHQNTSGSNTLLSHASVHSCKTSANPLIPMISDVDTSIHLLVFSTRVVFLCIGIASRLFLWKNKPPFFKHLRYFCRLTPTLLPAKILRKSENQFNGIQKRLEVSVKPVGW